MALCTVTFGFRNSKKNSFRGNFMRKYGMLLLRIGYYLNELSRILTDNLHNALVLSLSTRDSAFEILYFWNSALLSYDK